MKQIKAKILKNKKIAQGFYRMRIESPYLARRMKPGQFAEVRCAQGTDPLLPRPLGCHRILKNSIELLYEVVGKGTAMLAEKKAGETLELIGPLGKGFEITASRGAAILVAGGVGVAPLLALAERLAQRKRKSLYVLIGACTKKHILCEKEFKKIGTKVLIATEDGSIGHKGLVTDILLKTVIARHEVPKQSKKSRLLRRRFTPPRNDVANIYACGPVGMLKAVSQIAQTHRIPCQVSLEERMACGVGVCLGCPVRVKEGGYKMVCKDGPVFDAMEIAW